MAKDASLVRRKSGFDSLFWLHAATVRRISRDPPKVEFQVQFLVAAPDEAQIRDTSSKLWVVGSSPTGGRNTSVAQR